MRIYSIKPIVFTGQRQDRSTVAQLKQDNKYDLNRINQRRINQAITDLAEIPDEDNINFLIDVSENLKYGTNIDLNKKSYNEWREKLNAAIKHSYDKSSEDVQKRLAPKIATLNDAKPLTEDEKEILSMRDALLEKVDYAQLEKIPSDNIKNLPANLDYFIISSEVPISQKVYILKRLNYFMSDKYKIDAQLADKKTQALAEIINDIVVDTPESKIPNIKSVNQRHHGMCAAISICRKDLAFEDKPNYVDMILSELDNSPDLMIYDISKLGTNTKIPVPKTYIDFDYALSQGYRIVDTSALYWMHVADTAFVNNEPVGMYTSFDKTYFDTFHDSHLMPDINEELSPNQDYYRALLKSKEAIARCKKDAIIKDYRQNVEKLNTDNDLQAVEEYSKSISRLITEISPNIDKYKRQVLVADLKKLEVKNSEAAARINDYIKSFIYLPNETRDVKEEKIRAFLSVVLEDKNKKSLEKNVPEILDILEAINQTKKHLDKANSQSEFGKAKSLYEAAAAFRAQALLRLEVPEERRDLSISYGIPDRETLIGDNLDMLIQKLEILSLSDEEKKDVSKTQLKKAKLNNEIINMLAKHFQTEPDPEMLKIALKENKNTFDYIMTDLLDDFYRVSLMVDRKTVLKNDLSKIRQLVADGDDVVLLDMAKAMMMEPDKKAITEILDSYIETLSSKDCTNDDYIEIYNATGRKGQLQDFVENFKVLGKALFEDRDPKIIAGFNMLNGLPQDASPEDTQRVYKEIGDKFNHVSLVTTSLQNALEIYSSDGQILNTVIDKEIILKELENSGYVVSVKDLRAFQNRFNRASALLVPYDGASVRVKDLPRELKTFSPHEKEVLRNIEDNINNWYKQTTRALESQYKYLEEPLSELHRDVGVKTGMQGMRAEGSSGLHSAQEVKIIEHMTDRPYYIEENVLLAIDKVKKSPYSGISSTSVDDTAPAYHAQYISDIVPVKLKNEKGEIVEKEVLFHDNTWGPSEHENVWVDRNGMIRTDYSRSYGGELGYITDEKYQSGKFVDKIVGKYGVATPSRVNSKRYKKLAGKANEEFRYPMFDDVILSGKSPNADSQVRSIRNNTLISPLLYFDDLAEAAQKMSYSEVQNTIKKVEGISIGLYETFDNFQNRIHGNPPFDKGIKNKSDYDKLPENDPLKILMEQMALIQSYDEIEDTKLFYNEFSIEELNKTREKVRKRARNNFDYTFGKNPEIVISGSEISRKMLTEELQKFAEENNIKISPSVSTKIINSMRRIDRKKFDGRLYNTTVLMSESFAQALYDKTPDFDNKKEKIEVLKQKLQKYLHDNMSFTLKDLQRYEEKNGRFKNVINWVDRVFDPKDDEDFVRIFNNLQEMSAKEFEKAYGATIKDEDMGVKNITGFDVLNGLRSYDEKMERRLLNLLYARKLGKQLNLSPTKPNYNYNKFEKVLRGFNYGEADRTFDDIYYDYYWMLSSLNLQTYYEKMRKTYFEKYQIFPAYPIMEYEDKDEVVKIMRNFVEKVDESIESIDSYKKLDISIVLVHDLYKYISRFKDSTVLTYEQRNIINAKLRDFININGNDESIKSTTDAICELLKLPPDAPASEYKKNIKVMNDEISMFEKTPNGKTMEDAIQEETENLNKMKRDFITHNFAQKYHSKAYSGINHYIMARMSNSKDAKSILLDEFTALYDNHRITKKPEQLLNEYLLMICKSKSGEENKATKENINKIKKEISALEQSDSAGAKSKIKKLKKELEPLEQKYDITSTFATNLKGILDCANVLELEYIFMDCAKEANLNIVREEFKNSTVQLRNGKIVRMDSPEILNSIVIPLIIGENEETTMRFVEQLGLQEGVAKTIIKSSKIDNVRRLIIRIDNIFSAISEQSRYVHSELDKIGNIDNDPDYAEKIEQMRQNLLVKFKKTNYRKSVDILDAAFKSLLNEIKEHPELSKTAYLHLYMENLIQACLYVGSTEVQKKNEELLVFQHISDFAKKLKLPEGSEAEAEMNEFLRKIEELENLAQEHVRRYPEIGINTYSSDSL